MKTAFCAEYDIEFLIGWLSASTLIVIAAMRFALPLGPFERIAFDTFGLISAILILRKTYWGQAV